MIVITCVDQKNGLAFNGRRQSRDRMVAADILRESAGRRLWMTVVRPTMLPLASEMAIPVRASP